MAEGRTAWPVEPDGWYVEPEAATSYLLAREEVRGPIWDPCCGMGNIVRACHAHGLEAWGTDLRRRECVDAAWFTAEGDFLSYGASWGSWRTPRAIIMNPPYGRALLAEAFIRRALELDVDKVCAFVNAKFIFSDRRARGLFAEHPPLRVYPVLPRPSCPPGQVILAGGKAEGGVENYCWMVFAKGRVGAQTDIRWG